MLRAVPGNRRPPRPSTRHRRHHQGSTPSTGEKTTWTRGAPTRSLTGRADLEPDQDGTPQGYHAILLQSSLTTSTAMKTLVGSVPSGHADELLSRVRRREGKLRQIDAASKGRLWCMSDPVHDR